VISHNHANPSARIHLTPSLSVAYERKIRSNSQKVSTDEVKKIIEDTLSQTSRFSSGNQDATPGGKVVPVEAIEGFSSILWETLLRTFPPQARPVKPEDPQRLLVSPSFGKEEKTILKAWNHVLEAMDQLLMGKAERIPEYALTEGEIDELTAAVSATALGGPSPELSLEDEKLWAEQHPESFDKDGVSYFRRDIELLDVAEGQHLQLYIHNGTEYHAVVGTPVGPSKPKKSRGKTAVREPSHSPREASKDSSREGRVRVGGKDQTPVIATENPLRVKGQAKSKALSEGQRKTLRQFFKLEEGLIPPDIWAGLSNAERSSELSKRSIPRWATESVLRSPSNIQLIVEGKITKENAQTAPRSPKVGMTKPVAQALEAWQGLKSDFKGTPLLRTPLSSKEKAFRKRFDSLVETYGKQPCFPKLKESPTTQGRNRSSSSSRGGADSTLLDILRLVGEVARAFSGK
jgi:hypothetical protein